MAIIIHGSRVLLLKRVSLPFLSHSGIWTFPAGRGNPGEPSLKTAYREVLEETGLEKIDLSLLSKQIRVTKVDEERKRIIPNKLYVFRSKKSAVRLDYENTDYRWASLADIRDEHLYDNVFADPAFILKVIRKALKK
ncbi:MAG: NUDIX domain-containing protein [Candidatus Micrarchaeota archaeon]|nr:NUDIX domain-containing protein [Candidatus Micrarchaeota archaeon]